ncbi:class I SAM-dependent methyltransferase [Streptomyces sp. NPDC102467]|uniref:class I SAM-dependent methyltransferase n=1 Tax=Streptomyces sp. NPDC102467 TaxID=3366179 RepID=UPI00381B84A9
MSNPATAHKGAAARLAALADDAFGGPLPLALRTWDGSEAGPTGTSTVVVRHRRALRRLLWHPGELGLAQAYVTGEIDVDGDLGEALRTMWRAAREQAVHRPRVSLADRARAVRTLIRLGALGPPPAPPVTQSRLRGALHSRARDRAAISHHYDLSNAFYGFLLDDTMAYSCAFWPEPASDAELAHAQRAKLELICQKLQLSPGDRLLDIGCGWGALTLYAAEHHDVQVAAVTLAAEQATYVEEQARARGLENRVEVRCQDYREPAGVGYDAVVSIEMGEHVGDAEYPAFARLLHDRTRPGGRILLQQMSRGRQAPGGGAFIEAFIAPDMHMRPLGETVTLIEGAGLEVVGVEAMREHYVHTVAAWLRTLEEGWDEAVRLIGEEGARVWRLYLVGGGLAFEQGRMGVDQMLAVRPEFPAGAGS